MPCASIPVPPYPPYPPALVGQRAVHPRLGRTPRDAVHALLVQVHGLDLRPAGNKVRYRCCTACASDPPLLHLYVRGVHHRIGLHLLTQSPCIACHPWSRGMWRHPPQIDHVIRPTTNAHIMYQLHSYVSTKQRSIYEHKYNKSRLRLHFDSPLPQYQLVVERVVFGRPYPVSVSLQGLHGSLHISSVPYLYLSIISSG